MCGPRPGRPSCATVHMTQIVCAISPDYCSAAAAICAAARRPTCSAPPATPTCRALRAALPALRARLAARRGVRALPERSAALRCDRGRARLRIPGRRARACAQVPRRAGGRGFSGQRTTTAHLAGRGRLRRSVPLSTARLRQRGYNHAGEIARTSPRKLELALRARPRYAAADGPAVRRAATQRARRLRCTRAIARASVAVVDDVMTTGATLNEVAKTLKDAGAARVVNWVVARTFTRD